MGLIAMSERDLQRIEVLSKVADGRMTMVSASHVLALSERQVRRLLAAMSRPMPMPTAASMYDGRDIPCPTKPSTRTSG
ncbi:MULTISPECIES: hypothetical protein [Rhizobium]|uniref:Winged helix-turn helix n=2 Tax=Rhizobium TaxID=379 RepID=A0A7W6MJ44_9HYPH|nr:MULTISPECIES: hypothetical protein [Rhizobium]MBB4193314.1 hypothetical protein [Rhizobium aethiopicum]MBB4583011.1 hypothetical protein [Rhizobium aethiopicum]PCD64069.1 hypothetical protein CO648_31090 [Rhizobium phaseoli]PDS93061.1 hypothetical protein CO659_31770 [Rhizobium sp. S9]PDT19091.1 hypothetical protein CO674_35030 [Rhizobium hidalgonense]